MKKLFLLLLMLVPVCSFAQDRYVIIGKIKNIQAPAKVYLSYRRAGERSHWDSTTVKNDVFEFNGIITDTIAADIYVDYKGISLDDIWGSNKSDSKRIYLTGGTIYLTGDDSACNAKLSGTKINADDYRYTTLIKSAASDSIRAILDKKFIEKNPGSYISLDKALKDLDNMDANVNEMQPVFNSLTAEVRTSKGGILFKNYLAALKATTVGAIAPGFAEPDTSGKMLRLSSLRGKYILVDFWASWCKPCRAENPNLLKIFNKYKTKNFTILGVSLDYAGGKNAWLSVIRTDGLNWNQVADFQGWKNDAALLYAVKNIPQNLLIDPSGKIIAKNLFADDLEKKLDEILGK